MIYIASPFFCPRELGVVQLLEEVLLKSKQPFFSPRLSDDNSLTPAEKYQPDNAQKIFDSNLEAMSNCRLCIAYTDGSPYYNEEKEKNTTAKDMGTAWEMGWFYGNGTPIITFSLDNEPSNLMLARSVAGHFTTMDSLIDAIYAAAQIDFDNPETNIVKGVTFEEFQSKLLASVEEGKAVSNE